MGIEQKSGGWFWGKKSDALNKRIEEVTAPKLDGKEAYDDFLKDPIGANRDYFEADALAGNETGMAQEVAKVAKAILSRMNPTEVARLVEKLDAAVEYGDFHQKRSLGALAHQLREPLPGAIEG